MVEELGVISFLKHHIRSKTDTSRTDVIVYILESRIEIWNRLSIRHVSINFKSVFVLLDQVSNVVGNIFIILEVLGSVLL